MITTEKAEFYTSNGMKIPFNNNYFQPLKVAGISDRVWLAQQYKADGYVYLKSFLDRETILNVRRQYMELFDEAVFKEGTDRMDGIFSGTFQFKPSEHGLPSHPASQFAKSKVYSDLTSDPKLKDLASLLLDADVVQLKRKPLRHFYKGTYIASKAHCDYTYLNDGTENLLSIWIPLGDITMQTGGLLYLRNSDKLDIVMLRKNMGRDDDPRKDDRPISKNLKAIADVTHEPWLYSDLFSAGDIVVHNPFIVHASLDCNTDYMRFSTDIRFADVNGRIDPRWLETWRGDDGY